MKTIKLYQTSVTVGPGNLVSSLVGRWGEYWMNRIDGRVAPF